MPRKTINVELANVEGGINLIHDPLKIRKNQVQNGTLNAILTRTGPERRPGTEGLSVSNNFTTYLKGLAIYLQQDSTEKLLALSNGKLYEVNKTTEALTEKYDLTGLGEGVIKTFKDKAWVCNGTEVIKLENGTAYQVGLTAPSGSTATGSGSGGTLAAGVYKIFISYYRKVDSTIILYSVGESVSNVTLSGATSKITFTVPDSSDSQVDGVTVWMTDEDGTVYYSYHTEDGAGAYSFDITSNTNRDTSLLYSVEAINNQRPAAFTYIEFHNLRMYGIDPTTKSRIWYSIKASTVYDLEKFPNTGTVSNKIDFDFEVTGLISLRDHLYINTKGGMYRLPYGDPSQRPELVDKSLYFREINTIAEWNGKIIGVTNDGVRFFNGEYFEEDLSKEVKPEIDKIYNAKTNHRPCGIIYRRKDKRTEYHLTYQDTNVGKENNNRRLVLNLSSIGITQAGILQTPWEIWDTGAEYMAVDSANTFFNGQSVSAGSHIYKEKDNNTFDYAMYDDEGTFLTSRTESTFTLKSRQVLPNISARTRYNLFRALAQINRTLTVQLVIADRYNVTDSVELRSESDVPLFGVATFGVSRFNVSSTLPYKKKLGMNMKGYSFYLILTQTSSDPNFKILSMIVNGVMENSRFT